LERIARFFGALATKNAPILKQRNIITLREYAARLEIIVKFYWESKK